MFVGGLAANMTTQRLRQYIVEVIGVEPENVTINRQNDNNSSFKVTVNSADKNDVFNPEFWDEGIIVKPFRESNTRAKNVNQRREQPRDQRNQKMPYWRRWTLNKPFTSRWDQHDEDQPAANITSALPQPLMDIDAATPLASRMNSPYPLKYELNQNGAYIPFY